MIPTIGRTVIYKTTEEERAKLEELGKKTACNVQDELPATIVAVWGEHEEAAINLKVHIDGDIGDWWITSRTVGENEGEWHWPTKL